MQCDCESGLTRRQMPSGKFCQAAKAFMPETVKTVLTVENGVKNRQQTARKARETAMSRVGRAEPRLRFGLVCVSNCKRADRGCAAVCVAVVYINTLLRSRDFLGHGEFFFRGDTGTRTRGFRGCRGRRKGGCGRMLRVECRMKNEGTLRRVRPEANVRHS